MDKGHTPRLYSLYKQFIETLRRILLVALLLVLLVVFARYTVYIVKYGAFQSPGIRFSVCTYKMFMLSEPSLSYTI